MASSARFPSHGAIQHPRLSISTHTCPQLLAPPIFLTSQNFRPPASFHLCQRRPLFWWSRFIDSESRSRGKSRLQRLTQKAKEIQIVYNKGIAHARRRQPYLYKSWRSNNFHGPEQTSHFHRRCDVHDEFGKGMRKGNQWAKSWVAKAPRFKNGFEDSRSPGEKNDFQSWDSKEREFGESLRRESEQRFEKFKKILEHDPYGVIFGRRLQPFPFGLKEGSWLSFYKSLFGGESPMNQSSHSSSSGDNRKFRADVKTEPEATTLSEAKPNENDSPSPNTTINAAFEFDPISGRMVPTQAQGTDSQLDDTSPIILSNPRDGEAEAEPHHEQSNIALAPNVDTEEPVIVEPEQPVCRKTISPDDLNDQSPSKAAQTCDTTNLGTVDSKQRPIASKITSADSATVKPHPGNVGQKVDPQKPVFERSETIVSKKAAMGPGVEAVPKPDVWHIGEPEKPAGANALTSNSEEASTATLDANNKSSMHSSPQFNEEDAANRASDFDSYRYLIAKRKKRLDNTGRIPEEWEGMSHSDLLQHLDTPSESPICEVDQKAYDVSDGTQEAEEDVDRLRASDIRASYKNRVGDGRDPAKKTYEALQDDDCGLDVDELRWKLRPDNKNAGNVDTAQHSTSSAKTATVRLQEAINSLLDRDDAGAANRDKSTYIRTRGGAGDTSTTANDYKPDDIHPVFGVKTTDANRHSEISNIARELRGIKQATNTISAHLTEDRGPSEATVDCSSQNKNKNTTSSSGKMKNVMEERERQMFNIGETLSDVKNINASIISHLTELREVTQKMRSIIEDSMKKSPPDQNVSEKSASPPSTPSQYRVLAYDSLTMEVKDVGISSGHSGSSDIAQQLHPTEALSRLNNPSRFLDHFPILEAQGYEIVSGGGDILIFKKVRGRDGGGEDVTGILKDVIPGATTAKKREDSDAYDDGDSMLHSPARAAQLEKEAIDQFESGMATADPPGKLSPETQKGTPAGQGTSSHANGQAGQLSYDFEEPKQQRRHQQEQQQDSSTPPPPTAGKRRPFLRKALRRILLTGGVAAGTCYAFGVVVEYFRTGGQDGLGPQGFTGLEGR
ncbi:hypothetical protein ACJ72_00382 [Emergomyces africanus]|uniref:Uncharacterized protein n=1 Tax=Emergomyces africanus TaxID=1955775 RepID=A0A1B7P857_9EURO|nr:hypothetical protein ACJ72_00382 [Emergomyces africanus]